MDQTAHGTTVHFGGDWVVDFGAELEHVIEDMEQIPRSVRLEFSHIGKMDTLGAWLIYKLLRNVEKEHGAIKYHGLSTDYQDLLVTIKENDNPAKSSPPRRNPVISLAEDIGFATLSILESFGQLLGFVGLVLVRFLGSFRDIKRIKWTALVFQIEQVGLRAMPIVGLIAFLIGAVIVNQGAVQLRQFGLEIFVADMLTVSQLRELGVLLTAIIVAGRSGSAFTAQIGSMVLNEEVAAMETIGINPIDVLVLPRVLALVPAMVILTLFADIMGLIGGGLMAWISLDISPAVFADRVQAALVVPTTYWVGLIKAPVFGVVIAISGCLEGLSVKGTAESVGRHTTKSVVQSIFLVIVLDAVFAVFFTAIDW